MSGRVALRDRCFCIFGRAGACAEGRSPEGEVAGGDGKADRKGPRGA